MSILVYNDEYFMQAAYKQALLAFEKGEIPVGAVIVHGGKTIIAKAYNQTELLNDVTAHAEMLAITAAADYIGGKYLRDCALYVTLEPCPMCAGALYWSQLDKVIFGANDPKRGFSQINFQMTHPKTEIRSGIMEAECNALIKQFFAERRK